jgi:hypothetical protein
MLPKEKALKGDSFSNLLAGQGPVNTNGMSREKGNSTKSASLLISSRADQQLDMYYQLKTQVKESADRVKVLM